MAAVPALANDSDRHAREHVICCDRIAIRMHDDVNRDHHPAPRSNEVRPEMATLGEDPWNRSEDAGG